MSDVVEVRIHTEWHVNELSWWLRIESKSTTTGHIEEMIVRDDDLRVATPVIGELELSVNDYRLWHYIPEQNVVDAHMSKWVGVHGKVKARFCNHLLKSLRRCCRYAVLSCGAVRTGFDVQFADYALSEILNAEIAIRLEGLALVCNEVLLIDVSDLLQFLLCCAIEAENRRLFEDIYKKYTEKFALEWLGERRKLFEILVVECSKMSEWMLYVNSGDCCKFANRFVGANFEMLQRVLIDSQSQNVRKRRL